MSTKEIYEQRTVNFASKKTALTDREKLIERLTAGVEKMSSKEVKALLKTLGESEINVGEIYAARGVQS